MSFSELEAAAAALSEVGMPIEPAGAFIADLTEDAPAARELRPGDIITEVEGRPVRLLEDLAAALEEVEAGDPIALETLRQGRPRPVTVTAVAPEGDRSALGIVAVQYHRPPVEVSISADDIGGPSAGLMFALFIYDQLVPEDLTGGRTIAGTGTIQTGPQGSARVGEVGSVELKVKGALRLGADVFLVPREELQRARREAGDRLEVVGVSTLRDAVDALS